MRNSLKFNNEKIVIWKEPEIQATEKVQGNFTSCDTTAERARDIQIDGRRDMLAKTDTTLDTNGKISLNIADSRKYIW